MDLPTYMQEIEALVQHLSPHAGLLGDADLSAIEGLHERGVPLEAALAGIRKGAKRLEGLKRPPKGLPIKRVQGDVRKEVKRFSSDRKVDEASALNIGSAPATSLEDDSWREVVRTIAAEVPEAVASALHAIVDDPQLGEERAFVRFLAISGEYYQQQLDAMASDRHQALMNELAGSAREALASMSPMAREEMLQELALRRLASDDPVLEPRRFWQD